MSSTSGISTAVLSEQLAAANAEADRIASTFAVDEKGRISLSPEQATAYQKQIATAREVKGLLDARSFQAEVAAYLAGTDEVPAAASGLVRGLEGKSLADLFVDSPEYQDVQAKGFQRGTNLRVEVEGKSIFNISAGQTTHNTLGGARDLGLSERAMRQWHVRDLFPKSTTRDTILYGYRETGWTNNADQVPQQSGGTPVAAPVSDITLESVLYPVAEVAHTMDAHKNILNDVPRLKTFLNTRMIDGVKYREDAELLFGLGGTEKVTGIVNTPGVQVYTGSQDDKYSIQIRRAITKATLAEYTPTGVVISPTMWEAVEVETDDQGAFRVAVAVAVGAEKRVWRLNVVETTAMIDTHFLVGAFGMGAQLHDRESVSVSVSSEHADNFAKGMVTFRADERLALEVPRPESFVYGEWTEPA